MSKATSRTESSTDTEPASAPASVRETAIDFEGLGAGEEIDVTYESTHGGEKTVRACVLATRPRTDATGYLRAVRADSRRIILANTGKLWTVSVELDGDGNQDSRVVGYEPRAERIKGKDELEGSKDGADDDAVIRPGDDYDTRAAKRARAQPMALQCNVRGVVRVENLSHDDSEEHVYSVRAERDETGQAIATECSCPAFEKYGPCKHLKAVEAEGFVLDVAAPFGTGGH